MWRTIIIITLPLVPATLTGLALLALGAPTWAIAATSVIIWALFILGIWIVDKLDDLSDSINNEQGKK